MTTKYITQGTHTRITKKGRETFSKGSLIEPTPEELRAFPNKFKPITDFEDESKQEIQRNEPPQRLPRDARTRQGQDSTTE